MTGHGAHAVEIDLMMPLDPNKAPKVYDRFCLESKKHGGRGRSSPRLLSCDIFMLVTSFNSKLLQRRSHSLAVHRVQVHVPTLNHVGLWVDDLEKAVEFLKVNGMRFTPGGIRKGAAGHDVIFLHPKV